MPLRFAGAIGRLRAQGRGCQESTVLHESVHACGGNDDDSYSCETEYFGDACNIGPLCLPNRNVPVIRSRVIAIMMLASLSGAVAEAKCSFLRYQVVGQVLVPNGMEQKKVHIYLFLEGSSHASDYAPEPQHGDFALPGDGGTFEATAWYNTWSGGPGKNHSVHAADDCSRVALAGELVIVGEDIEAQRIPVVFGSSKKAIAAKDEIKAVIPDIALRRLSDLRAQ